MTDFHAKTLEHLMTTEDGVFWQPTDGFSVFTVDQDGEVQYKPLDTAVLAVLHPLLLEAVPAICMERAFQDHMHHIRWSFLSAQVELWENKLPELIDEGGYRYAVHAVNEYKVDTDQVLTTLDIDAIRYRMWQPKGVSTQTKLLTGLDREDVRCYTAYLESVFPKWLDRYHEGKLLGVSDHDMAKHMFGKPKPHVDVQWDGLNLDHV